MNLNNIPIQLAQIILAQATHIENAPDKKIEPGEIVVGVVEDRVTRSLYSLLRKLEQYGEDYTAANESERDRAKIEQHRVHESTLARLIDVVGGLFWHRIHEWFAQTNNTAVTTSIREGWQVVIWKSRETSRVETRVIDLGVVDLRKILSVAGK